MTSSTKNHMGFEVGGKATALSRAGNPLAIVTVVHTTRLSVMIEGGWVFTVDLDQGLCSPSGRVQVEILPGLPGKVDRLRSYQAGDEALVKRARLAVQDHFKCNSLIQSIRQDASTLSVLKITRQTSIDRLRMIAETLNIAEFKEPWLICQRILTLPDRYLDSLPFESIESVARSIERITEAETQVKS